MTLPLFPLNTVLFPGCNLDLQIFEPRYLDMVSRCLKAGHGFGVVRLVEGQEVGPAASAFAELGCEALIRDWQQRPNGLLGIRVEGVRRFRVKASQVQPDQLVLGEVEWLPPQDNPPTQAEHDDLVALLEALGRHPLVAGLGMDMHPDGAGELANRLAYLLPFRPEHKLALLGRDSAIERLAMVQVLVEQLQDDPEVGAL